MSYHSFESLPPKYFIVLSSGQCVYMHTLDGKTSVLKDAKQHGVEAVVYTRMDVHGVDGRNLPTDDARVIHDKEQRASLVKEWK